MKKKALLLMLFCMFISTNVLAQNVIWGLVTGDKISGVQVNVYKLNCGATERIGVLITNTLGQYGIGGLEDGMYTVEPEALKNYDFSPNSRQVLIIPEAEESGNVNFISTKKPPSCASICYDEEDYCMDFTMEAYMSCLIVGNFRTCWAELILEEGICEITKDCCLDSCPYECRVTER